MNVHNSRLTALILLALFFYSSPSSLAAPVIGTFDTTRATTANVATGSFGTQRRASQLVHYPGAQYVTTPTLTPAFLSGIDFLSITPAMTDTVGITPLSAAEQSALFNYVAGGGNVFLVADGFSPFVTAANSMLGPFGITEQDDGLTGTLLGTPTTHAHPVINGPFGDTSAIAVLGAGVITTLGPYAHTLATMNANGLPILAVIERNAIAPGSGRVVITTDASLFVDTAAGGFFPSHETLYLNIVNFLVPEPATWTLALAGAISLAFLKLRASRRFVS